MGVSKASVLYIYIDNTCYSCFSIKKFFKIKINKVIFTIDNVSRKIR